ncbi:lipoprotein, putative [Microscilla marina ATCC 23134]|uniref:Lipoprotein, putative n=2 Tax=Microscilla marina TaxID=1027 RepID=A1ZM30_MICM2|nr:lipoprotein, putative [Microscilla marina ATCC 23134]
MRHQTTPFMKHTFVTMGLWLTLTIALVGCSPRNNASRVSNCAVKITQGIYGRVFWVGGNQMPGPVKKGKRKEKNAPAGNPVAREVWVYPLMQTSQLNKNEGLYQKPATAPLAKTTADKDGCFQLPLAPGKYSIFTLEKDGLFANIFDGKGNVHPVEVKSNNITEVNININYKAAY